MPKGDRFILKADPEDGTTPIANLLLEAVAMAKISGLQKGVVLYLWRKTYGWINDDGKRKKEAKISLTEWARALDSTNPRVSRTLSDLEHMSIIERRIADMWGGYYYSLNTNISKWNSNCINLAKLSEIVGITDFATVTENATVTDMGNSYRERPVTVTENATQQLPKTQPPLHIIERNINKHIKEIYIVWNELEIIIHQKLTDDIKRAINTTLNDYGEVEIIQAIKNYAEILKDDKYYFRYKWTLKDFLKRGLVKFLDIEIARNNYSKDAKNGTHQGAATNKGYSAEEYKRGAGVGNYGSRVV
jgi:hypothetical protein